MRLGLTMLPVFSLMALLSLSPLVNSICKIGIILKLLAVICILLFSVICLVILMFFPVSRVLALTQLFILRLMLRCFNMLLMVSVFSMLFLPRFVVIMTMTLIGSLLLLVLMIFTLISWTVLILLPLHSRFAPKAWPLLVMLMLPSLEMAERSGCHEQPFSFAPGSLRCIKLLDGTTLRAWP